MRIERRLSALCALVIATCLWASSDAIAQSDSAEAGYRAGTDSGMRYLAAFGTPLRLTLLLQECGQDALASRVANSLPNSVRWFLDSSGSQHLSAPAREVAAQVTRAYILGYEAGVRLEFRSSASQNQQELCRQAVEAAR